MLKINKFLIINIKMKKINFLLLFLTHTISTYFFFPLFYDFAKTYEKDLTDRINDKIVLNSTIFNFGLLLGVNKINH
jgi:hypothetical protein